MLIGIIYIVKEDMTFRRSKLMGMALKAHVLEPLATQYTETSRKKASL